METTNKTRYKVRMPKGKWVYEWACKEEGSFEDHNREESHPFWFLSQPGKTVYMTQDEVDRMISSADYQGTSWQPDEIDGGVRTMRAICKFGEKLTEMAYGIPS